MLIGSINYNLSLGYVLTFLLAGVGIVSILHTFRNLAHLYVSAGRVAPVFARDTAQFELVFENKSDFDRHSLELACRGARVSCDVPARAHLRAISAGKPRRGASSCSPSSSRGEPPPSSGSTGIGSPRACKRRRGCRGLLAGSCSPRSGACATG